MGRKSIIARLTKVVPITHFEVYRTKRVGFVVTFRLAGAGKATLKLVVSSWGYEYPQMSGVRASDDQVWALSVRGAAMALLPVQYQPGQPH